MELLQTCGLFCATARAQEKASVRARMRREQKGRDKVGFLFLLGSST